MIVTTTVIFKLCEASGFVFFLNDFYGILVIGKFFSFLQIELIKIIPVLNCDFCWFHEFIFVCVKCHSILLLFCFKIRMFKQIFLIKNSFTSEIKEYKIRISEYHLNSILLRFKISFGHMTLKMFSRRINKFDMTVIRLNLNERNNLCIE